MECYYCNANADVFGGIKCVIGCEPYHLKNGGIGCCYNRATVVKRMKELMNKPITNYDGIVSKTPEELAEWIAGGVLNLTGGSLKMATEAWADWLRKEASL